MLVDQELGRLTLSGLFKFGLKLKTQIHRTSGINRAVSPHTDIAPVQSYFSIDHNMKTQEVFKDRPGIYASRLKSEGNPTAE